MTEETLKELREWALTTVIEVHRPTFIALIDEIERLREALMLTTEWVQSNYPGVKFPKDLLAANREILGLPARQALGDEK